MNPGFKKYATHSLIVWSALVCVFVLGPSRVFELKLLGPDDYMRFVQVFNWLDGASWFDVSEPRISPPGGIDHHWTRLADIPLAAVMSVVEPWAGRRAAVMTAAIVVPSVMFYVTLLALGWLAHPVVGRSRLSLTMFMGILSPLVIIQFLPGRVDHHQWILLSAAISLGALARMMIRPDAVRPPIIAAVAFALGLWVVGAMVAWLVAFNIALAIHWLRKGDRSLRAGFIFSAVLLALSVFILMTSKPASDWTIVAWDSFSIASVSITGLVFLFWGGLWLGADRLGSFTSRLLAAAGYGAVLLGGAVFLFHDYIDSPYGNVDPYLMKVWIANISEITSILTIFEKSPFTFLGSVGTPLVAFAVALFCSLRVDGRKRSIWIMFLVYLAIAIALSLWQKRFISATHLFSVVPLAWLLGTQWRRLEQTSLSLIGMFAAKSIMVIVFALGFRFFGILDSSKSNDSNCDIRFVAEALPQQAPKSPKLIAAVFNSSSEIIFRTPHAVLGAPYHRNNQGNLDLFALLQAKSTEAAHAVVKRRGIDYILICPSIWALHTYKGKGFKTFYDRLAADETPAWLTAIKLADETNLKLFEVVNR